MKENKKFKTTDLVFIGVFAALIAVCSWISIPLPSGIPVTLQTMAVCIICAVGGMKRGSASVLVYILLGIIGVPVFSGFKAGISAVAGTTGGYIVGFIFTALIVGSVSDALDKKNYKKPLKFVITVISMILGIAVCYAFGTAWFAVVYARTNEPAGLGTILGWCVLPYIIPDLVKIIVAASIAPTLRKLMKRV